MSATETQTSLASAADKLLRKYDLDFLQEDYEHKTGMSVPFNDCKRHYVEYLFAKIAAHSLLAIDNSLQLSPPLHVDILWHSHILETKRYREFEKMVLEAYRQSGRETDLEYLDHSVVDNKVGREERIEKTKGFYQMLGFTFVNTDEEEEKEAHDNDDAHDTCEDNDGDSSVEFMKVISAKESDISILSNSNQSSTKEDNWISLPEVTVPPGSLGITLCDDSRGAYVISKNNSRTALRVDDVILRVENEIVKTRFECADAFLKDKDRERTVLIERYVSEFSSPRSKSESQQQHVEEHPAMLSSKRAHDDTEDDSTQKKKSKVTVAQGSCTSSSVSTEESSTSQNAEVNSREDSSKSNIYTFEIQISTGKRILFKTKGSTLFSKVSRAFHTKLGWPEKDPAFLLDGRQIGMKITIGQLLGNELDGKVIHYIQKLRGC